MALRRDLEFRARSLSLMRQRLIKSGAIEVETPTLLNQTIAHPNTRLFTVTPRAEDAPATLYLQPSPELAMRGLIAAGSGQIFQICRAYRDEISDATHTREFTLLEWYAPHLDYLQMAEETARLVLELAPRPRKSFSCAELIEQTYGRRLHFMTPDDLADLFSETFGRPAEGVPGGWFDGLLEEALRPHTANALVTVIDYPMVDPCFAKRNEDGVAQRFEVYLDGVEVANGYQEIESGEDFLDRFKSENREREALGDEPLPLVQVHDLPACSGVAVGVDRIIEIAAADRA